MTHGVSRTGPLVLAKLLVILISTFFAGCSGEPLDAPDQTKTIAQAQTVDPTGEIGKKWLILGGAAVVGNPTTDVLALPGNIGAYQVFTNGVIVDSAPFGAVYLTHVIFNEWLSLQGRLNSGNEDLFVVVGLPVKDFERLPHPGGYLVDSGSFEGGRIVAEPGQPVHLISGPIYYRYLQVELNATVAPPLSAPPNLPLGLPRDVERPTWSDGEWARSQLFEYGEIFWKRQLNTEAVVVYFEQVHGISHFGQIYSYWKSKGGPAMPLGFPLTSPDFIFAPSDTNKTTPLGLVGRFEHGSAYHNLATGGTYVVKGDLLGTYESTTAREDGSHPQWLGFPISDEGVTPSGKTFNDFEHGVLVSYVPDATQPAIRKVVPFKGLEFWLDRIEGFGCDAVACSAGDVDLRYNLRIWIGGGLAFDQVAEPDEWWSEPNWKVGLTGAAQSSFSFNVQLDTWDDDLWPDGDDYSGSRWDSYSIDNLWGADDPVLRACNGFDLGGGASEQTCAVAGSPGERTDAGDAMQAWYSVKHPLPLTGSYLADYNWSFSNDWENFGPMGTDSTFASTFADVSAAWLPPGVWLSSALRLAYRELVYGGLDPVADGACFGMNIEATDAKNDESPFSLPLAIVGPNQANSKSNIDIKHGYQLGVDALLYQLAYVLTGATAPGISNALSLAYWELGMDPQISISEDLFSYAHVVRPYRWETFSTESSVEQNCTQLAGTPPPCTVIRVADPNRPLAVLPGGPTGCPSLQECITMPATCPAACQARLDIGLTFQDFAYTDDGGERHVGSGAPLGFLPSRLIVLPSSLYDHPQYTPFHDPLAMVGELVSVLFGDSSEAYQISDDAGRRVFKENLGRAPTGWDDLEEPGASRLNMIPISTTSARQEKSTSQFYFGRRLSGTQTYAVGPGPSAPSGAPFEVGLHSGKLGALVTIPGTPGQVERLFTYGLNTAKPAFGIALAAGAPLKPVKVVLSGADKYRSITLSNLKLVGAQTFKARLEKGGYALVYNNDGPATSAELTVVGGRSQPAIALGTVELASGEGVIDVQAPRTTLTISGEVHGNDGWLLAPVSVALSAVDFSGSGIAAIEWSLDGNTFTPYSGPFVYASEGATTLYYRARDNRFNQEVTKTHLFKIDTRRPTATGTVSTSAGVVLNYSVTDPTPGSGALGLFSTVQGPVGPLTVFTAGASGSAALPTQCSAVEFWGVDVAGNEQSPHVSLQDSVAPVFTFVPPDLQTTQCTNFNIGQATAVDDCSAVTVTNNAPTKFPLGITLVTWTAKDVKGNSATAIQKITAILGDDPSCCPNGTNIILGNNNANTMVGTTGSDCILLRGGNDTLNSFGGNDFVSGGAGNDTITTGNGNDYLNGGAGVDTCYALGGMNTVLNCEVSP